jgi:hypothetical protein
MPQNVKTFVTVNLSSTLSKECSTSDSLRCALLRDCAPPARTFGTLSLVYDESASFFSHLHEGPRYEAASFRFVLVLNAPHSSDLGALIVLRD